MNDRVSGPALTARAGEPWPAHTGAVPPAGVLMDPGADHRPRARPGQRLHQLFEARCDALLAAGRGDHLAIDGPAARLSYPALDAWANRLARWLHGQGVRPGDRIALLFDKSAWGHAAMLAVGKLHAAYVPLDPGFPAERIAFILADAGVSRLLATTPQAGLAAAARSALAEQPRPAGAVEADCPVHLLDQVAGEIDRLPAHRPAAQQAMAADAADAGALAPADPLAYVIYTSGSTGRPKGVPIRQSQIVNFVAVAAETYGYRDDDRVYQGLTLAFDFAVEEIWVPLAVGATLLPSGSGGSLLGEDLAAFLRAQRATALCCVPTALATLDEDLPQLGWLMVSGEACPRDLVARWARPGRVFLNAYGPTEATVTATLGRPQPGAPVTIGRPLPTYAILVMAPDAPRVLPFGEEGEIVIGGAGVAEGYLNRPEQTARAFIPDTVGVPHNASGRLYRTGDLGRINAQGELEYLGRIDTQVKIRGYRIELAEIESVLLGLPGVAQAAVQPYSPAPGLTELVAYTVPPVGEPPADPVRLAAALRERLPAYMVPSCFEHLDRMPMLASDKTDRHALPPPRQARLVHTGGRPAVAPATPTEALLAGTLAALLGLPAVSVEDHVFDDLGANSLLMARWSARLRREAGLDAVSMRLIYGHPTVRGLAAALAAEAGLAGPDASAAAVAALGGAASGTVRPAGAGAACAAACSPDEVPAHRASAGAHAAFGAAQALLGLGWLGLHAAAWWHLLHWVIEAPGWWAAWGRAVLATAAYTGAATVLPVGLKWLLVGRWRAGRFPLWGLRHLRLWAVKMLVRSSPVVLLAGTPLYTLYLRLLGARIHPGALVALRRAPVSTDLLEVGAEAVLGANGLANGYRVERGWVELGPVRVGARAVVGEGALLDIDTRLGDGATLAHASSLQRGQQVPEGAHWQGSPARPAPGPLPSLQAADGVLRGSGRAVGAARRAAYGLAQLVVGWGITGALLPLGAYALWGGSGHALDGMASLSPGAAGAWHAAADAGARLGWAGWGLLAAGLYLAGLALALAWVATVPRWASAALRPGRLYRLYGLHHALLRLVQAGSNAKAFNALFGDSSAIVHYLRAVGWRFPGLQQTGSNFGMAQQHDLPTLCSAGAGTMVSDGLTMLNAEYGAQGFKLHALALGARCFLGNAVLVPPGHRVGDDCLLANKLMLPVDGPLQQGVGLLGSPPMVIPRSVRRDALVEPWLAPDRLARSLAAKNRANGVVMLAWLASHALPVAGLAMAWHAAYGAWPGLGAWLAAGFAAAALPVLLLWSIGMDWLSRGGRPLAPMHCAIYEPAFWRHERHWKLGLASDHPLMAALAGTPFRAWVWRAMGVQVGRRLFDDGCAITEKTLVRLGDDCCLGELATLQGHSLEDGVFKSDRLWLGDGVTVGANAYVHYAVACQDGAVVAPDAFVMKGSQLEPGERWQGNPAQPVAALPATARQAGPVPVPEPAGPVPAPSGNGFSARAGTARPAP